MPTRIHPSLSTPTPRVLGAGRGRFSPQSEPRIIDVEVITVGQSPARSPSAQQGSASRLPVITEVPAFALSERLVYQRNARPRHLGTRPAGLFLNTIA